MFDPQLNRANISNHAFYLIKLTGLKEEHYFKEIASEYTKMRIEVIFWSRESLVGLCFIDLENETFSRHHLHNKFKAISILNA